MSLDNITPDHGVNSSVVDLQAKRNEAQDNIVTVAHPSVYERGWTDIPNNIIRDESLDAEAAFLLIFLCSHKSTFNCNQALMRRRMGCCLEKLKQLFAKLFDAGYVTIEHDRNNKGHIIGSKRVFSKEPIFLEKNKATRLKRTQLKAVTESRENRRSVQPTVGKADSIKNTSLVKNTKLVKNTISKTNNNRDLEKEFPKMFVVEIEKVNRLYERLNDKDMARDLFDSLVEYRGEEFISKWIAEMDTKGEKIGSRGGYLRSMTRLGALPARRKQKSVNNHIPDARYKSPEETQNERVETETREERYAKSKLAFDKLKREKKCST